MKYNKFYQLITLVFMIPLLAITNATYTLKGKAVRMIDGDTFDLLVDKTTYRIRLAGIDAPEKGQDFGSAAKQTLGSLCAAATVTVVVTGTDRNKRKIADVYTVQKNG